MEQQEVLKVLELANTIVTAAKQMVSTINTRRLKVVFNAYGNVSLVHHGHVVDTISDCKSDLLWLVLLDQLNDVSLLRWRHPTTNKYFRRQSQLHEAVSQPGTLSDLKE